MTEGETISSLNEDGLFKGTRIAYYSVGTLTHANAAKPGTFTHTYTHADCILVHTPLV